MVEGLFFNGVHVLGDDGSIGMGVKDTILVLPHLADAKFPVRDDTVMAAKKTVDLVSLDFFVEKGFFEHRFYSLTRGIISDSSIDRKASVFLRTREPVTRLNGVMRH